MALTEFVIMPGADYQAICDAVRAKTGGTELLKSGDIPSALENISGGGEKILYMDAALLDAGGAYPADADDYTTAVIPAEATYVSLDAFDNLPNIDTVIINGDCEFETYSAYDSNTKKYTLKNVIAYGCVVPRKVKVIGRSSIPSEFLYGYGVLREVCTSGAIGRNAFYLCDFLKKAELKNCPSIGVAAFSGCICLSEIILPYGLTSIGNNAFYACRKLSQITIPESVTEIGTYAFQGCSSLTTIVIPDGVTTIQSGCFQNCTSLTKITIPASVTTISTGGGYANTIPAKAVIRGYAGSYAETYATAHGYTFEVIE